MPDVIATTTEAIPPTATPSAATVPMSMPVAADEQVVDVAGREHRDDRLVQGDSVEVGQRSRVHKAWGPPHARNAPAPIV
jgi:hypothetical protein